MHVRHLVRRLVRRLGWLVQQLCRLWGCQKSETRDLKPNCRSVKVGVFYIGMPSELTNVEAKWKDRCHRSCREDKWPLPRSFYGFYGLLRASMRGPLFANYVT